MIERYCRHYAMGVDTVLRYQKRVLANISPFTMILKGVISADVGGGSKMYKDAFFTDEFAITNPDKAGMAVITWVMVN